MTTKERVYTADEFMALPDDGNRYELVQGELVEMPTPSRDHALISARLLTRLSIYAEDHDLGQVTGSDGGFLLHTDPDTSRETIRIPDVAFTVKGHQATTPGKIYQGAPDLAVEVISPSETFNMIRAKLREYFAYGAKLVWLVYPNARIIEVYRNPEDDPEELDASATLNGGEVLPGFGVKVHDIFAVLD